MTVQRQLESAAFGAILPRADNWCGLVTPLYWINRSRVAIFCYTRRLVHTSEVSAGLVERFPAPGPVPGSALFL